jgi:bifunctional non-homologous end joining protein LigD
VQHEIKHDGFRLMVRREGARVRLWTRGGHDWADRFPRIVEAAHMYQSQVIRRRTR